VKKVSVGPNKEWKREKKFFSFSWQSALTMKVANPILQFAELPLRPAITSLAYLVLDEELDTLNGGGSGLGDSSGNTTHYSRG
jgi:hypothetical protein